MSWRNPRWISVVVWCVIIGGFLVESFLGNDRGVSAFVDFGFLYALISWGNGVLRKLETIEHELNDFPYGDRQESLFNKDLSNLTNKDHAIFFPPSIKDTLDAINHKLESIQRDFSGDWSGELTDKEEMERYERSAQGRLQAVEHTLKLIEHEFSGNLSETLTDKEALERYEGSIKGRLQSIEHALESMKRSIEDRPK
jgi:hypothetical protein